MSDVLKPVTEILVPVDFSECSLAALEFAKRMVVACDARLHLLFVDDDPMLVQQTTDPSFRDEHLEQMSAKLPDLLSDDQLERFRAVMVARTGTAYYEIEQYAEQSGIELIVMGNVGRSAIADVLLGSVTAHVLRHASCPVLSVKSSSSGSG
jgi:nucleotide-binding universal stress UspA family protein